MSESTRVATERAAATAAAAGLVGDQAAEWDRTGQLPIGLLRKLGAAGQLCAQVEPEFGGRGWSSRENGEFTASVGELCSSLRSIMTSQGMAAWTIDRLGTAQQRRDYLRRLVGGELAAVAFSEAEAGSDLSAMTTRVAEDGEEIVLNGTKHWITGAAYADLIVVFAESGDGGGAAVVVPTDAPGVSVERLPDPLGCRAAGHSVVRLENVRLPRSSVLGGIGLSMPLLITVALAYGRMSVAWGCVGILRSCLGEAVNHARTREQFGRPVAQHQLIARRLSELYTDEQVASRVCEHASAAWDANSPDFVSSTVLAKQVCAQAAARGSASAVQVLASAGSQDGHPVARAYRDSRLMEIIEGSTELCHLLLADQALAVVPASPRSRSTEA